MPEKKSLKIAFIIFVVIWILANFGMSYITYVIILIGWVLILFIGIRHIIYLYHRKKIK